MPCLAAWDRYVLDQRRVPACLPLDLVDRVIDVAEREYGLQRMCTAFES